MERVIVTGAAGFIGSQLCQSLLDAGVEVIGVDSFTEHYGRDVKQENLNLALSRNNFRFYEVDVADSSLGDLIAGTSVVFHLAARPGVRDSWADFDDYVHSNIVGTKSLLSACVDVPTPPRFVYASSSSVYGNAIDRPVVEDARLSPVSPYGASKVMTETLAGAYGSARGLEVVGLRYFTVYGPRQRPDMGIARFISAAVEGRDVHIYGDGKQMRDFTFVDDVVRATVLAAERGTSGHVYNIASGQPLPLMDILEEIGYQTGEKLRLVFDDPQAGDVRDTWADTRKAADELGFSAEVSIKDGLAAQVAETLNRKGNEIPSVGDVA